MLITVHFVVGEFRVTAVTHSLFEKMHAFCGGMPHGRPHDCLAQANRQEDALLVKTLKTRATPDVSACTVDDVVATAITNLESLLQQCKIMNDAKVFMPSQIHRLAVTDVRVLSSRSSSGEIVSP